MMSENYYNVKLFNNKRDSDELPNFKSYYFYHIVSGMPT